MTPAALLQCHPMEGFALNFSRQIAPLGLLVFLAWLTPASMAWGQGGASASTMPLGERWVVLFKDDTPALVAPNNRAPTARIAPAVRLLSGALTNTQPLSTRTQRLSIRPGTTSAQLSELLDTLRKDPAVKSVEPDLVVRHHAATPNDPGFSDTAYTSSQPVGQWYLKGNVGEVRSAIQAAGAWPYSQGSSEVVIAVLDTGVRLDHPDLLPVAMGGRMLAGYDFVSADFDGGSIRANDGDGWDPDPSDPGDWIDEALLSANPTALAGCDVGASSWHGTRTSALIGALSQNGLGIAGVDWNARLLPVRVLGRCGGHTSDIVIGIRWAAGLPVPGVPDNPYPAKVINLSLGHTGPCTQFEQATIDEVTARGVVVVASAGNDQGAVESPGNCRGVIAVGGLRHLGTKVGFSSLGAEVAISAPGGNCVNIGAGQSCLYSIDTATNSGKTVPEENIYTTQFKSNVGTSFAAPLVSGVVGLMLAVNGALTPTQVRAAIQSSAASFVNDPTLPSCPTLATGENNIGQCNCVPGQCGAGMLNAAAAVQQVNPAGCFFNWAQRSAPHLFGGAPVSRLQEVYDYRYYPLTDAYLAIAGDTGHVLYLGAQGLSDLGSRASWFSQAGCP